MDHGRQRWCWAAGSQDVTLIVGGDKASQRPGGPESPGVPVTCGSHQASLGTARVTAFLANSQGLPDARAVLLKHQHATSTHGGLVHTGCWGPALSFRVSGSGMRLGMCTCNQLPAAAAVAATAGLGSTSREALMCSQVCILAPPGG